MEDILSIDDVVLNDGKFKTLRRHFSHNRFKCISWMQIVIDKLALV